MSERVPETLDERVKFLADFYGVTVGEMREFLEQRNMSVNDERVRLSGCNCHLCTQDLD